MRGRTLLLRGLRHYWRANAAVVLGVAAAAAALGGSLVVGDSVRGSLAATALERLGRTTHVVESPGFFREALAAELAARPELDGAVPVVALSGAANHGTSRRRAGDVLVYGVDERFWSFHGTGSPERLGARDALLGEALAVELGAAAGDSVLVRLHAASDIPGSSLFGRRDDSAASARVTVQGVLPRERLGELSWRPRSGPVRAVFLPLGTLQRALGLEGRVNAVLAVSKKGAEGEIRTALSESLRLEDLGLRLRTLPEAGALQLETTSALVGDTLARTASELARRQGLAVTQVLVYLANTLRVAGREVPYSLVAAVDDEALAVLAGRDLDRRADPPPLVLNDWAAASLDARPGATVDLDYFLWQDEGRLGTASATFELAAVTPMAGVAGDRALAPEYPGITESQHLSDWDPPFPVDLGRIRPEDEAYWDRRRATPKAFLPLAVGQRLWGHPQGRLTSLRLVPPPGTPLEAAHGRFAAALLASLRDGGATVSSAPVVLPARETALAAARGSTDFGEYFAYFSFFLVVAGLLLAGLFFRLGLEQRVREVGLLEALGFPAARLRRHYLGEGALLAGLGAALGAAGAVGYAALVLWALRASWSDALGTRDLELHVRPWSPVLGAVGAALAAALAIAWTLRELRRQSARSRLAGAPRPWRAAQRRRRIVLPAALATVALVLVAATRVDILPETAGFFGAGGLLLVAALVLAHGLAARRPARPLAVRSVAGLGWRGIAFRPGRSVVCIALVAAATFVIVAVGAFRHDGSGDLVERAGPSGGYRLLAWSVAPLFHDLSTPEGREALGLEPTLLEGVSVARFRARRGDDASCLNLYRPSEPTVLGASPAFLAAGRFRFQGSLAETAQEQANPWRLLERERGEDGAIPVVADAGSLAYVLHRKLGDVLPLGATGVRARIVGALAPGLLQSELVTSERHFESAFPERAGASFFLLDVPHGRQEEVATGLEEALSDFGFDVASAGERLAAFHRVENTYIATFQALGALGLLLGVVGLATVLARNALEQRGELALLRAVGYRARHVSRMVLAENAALVGLGFLAGAVPALVAIAPMLLERRAGTPLGVVAALFLALAATAALVSGLAVAFIRRLPLLASLRSE